MAYKPKILSIADGGTNASSMSTSTGINKYDGTSLVTSTTALIDSSNRMTNASQPCFTVVLASDVTNVTGDGTNYDILFDTTVFDLDSNITLNSGGKTIFTAPVTGYYYFSFTCTMSNIAAGHNAANLRLFGSTFSGFPQVYSTNIGNIGTIKDSNNAIGSSLSQIIRLVAAETIFCRAVAFSSTKTITIPGFSSPSYTCVFSGHLIC